MLQVAYYMTSVTLVKHHDILNERELYVNNLGPVSQPKILGGLSQGGVELGGRQRLIRRRTEAGAGAARAHSAPCRAPSWRELLRTSPSRTSIDTKHHNNPVNLSVLFAILFKTH